MLTGDAVPDVDPDEPDGVRAVSDGSRTASEKDLAVPDVAAEESDAGTEGGECKEGYSPLSATTGGELLAAAGC